MVPDTSICIQKDSKMASNKVTKNLTKILCNDAKAVMSMMPFTTVFEERRPTGKAAYRMVNGHLLI